MKHHALGCERRAAFIECALDAPGDFQRVGAILLGHHELHAGSAHDGGRPDRRLRRSGDVRHVTQCKVGALRLQQHGPGDALGRDGLALGLQHQPLVGGVDEAGAADAGGLTRGGQHVIHRSVGTGLEPDFDDNEGG